MADFLGNLVSRSLGAAAKELQPRLPARFEPLTTPHARGSLPVPAAEPTSAPAAAPIQPSSGLPDAPTLRRARPFPGPERAEPVPQPSDGRATPLPSVPARRITPVRPAEPDARPVTASGARSEPDRTQPKPPPAVGPLPPAHPPGEAHLPAPQAMHPAPRVTPMTEPAAQQPRQAAAPEGPVADRPDAPVVRRRSTAVAPTPAAPMPGQTPEGTQPYPVPALVPATSQTVVARPQVTPARREGPAAAPEPAPTIQVTIGRIEVRATPPPEKRARKPRPEPAVMTLDEYLRQRNNGGSR